MDAKSYSGFRYVLIYCRFRLRQLRGATLGSFLSAFLALTGVSLPVTAQIPAGFSSELIQVRFAEGTDVDPPSDALPSVLLSSVESITRLFGLPEATLNELRARGEAASRESLPDLNLWFEIKLIAGTDASTVLADLQAQPNVDEAQLAPLPLPMPAVTPAFTGLQGYLGPAPDGIDAAFSSTLPGGNGAGITIYDVEYNWLQTHEDLSAAVGVAPLLDPGDSNNPPGFPGCPAPCNSINREHGTAVLGELIADNDTKGVTGISWGATIGLAPANTTNLGYNPANAILLAVADAEAGDVILLEQQTGVCGLADPANTCANCGPLEWIQSVFDAIQAAVANRIVVVEAAGNGGVNLDQMACGTTFDRTVRDSGAIIVGAGGSPGSGADRQRLGFSSFGNRADLQGWGNNVMTTGYGSHYTNADDPTNPAFFYRSTFSGTSSASPIVAGAVANLQGISKDLFGTPILPFQIRSLLRDTGSPQLGDTSQNIGPRPDLQAAVAQITEGDVDLYFLVDLSGSFTDDLPIFQAQAPGIIDSIKAANPNTQFGLGQFEDYPIPPFGDAGDGDVAYERLLDITPDANAMKTLIAGLSTGNGLDLPQSQLAALFQAASGAGQDLSGAGFPGASIPGGQQANFRNGATKLFLMWTDAAFHLPGDPGNIPYPGPSFAATVAAIEALDPPMVLGISVAPHDGLEDLKDIATATGAFAPVGGVDCDGDGIADIAEGEPMVCLLSSFGQGIGEAIVNIVAAAVEAAKPVAQCMDVTVPTDPGVCSAAASVDNGSFDPDGGLVTLTQSPPGPYPLGETVVTLKVSDETGLANTCVATVTVEDVEPPVISSINANPNQLWPPNHKMVPVTVAVDVSDNCNAAPVCKITSVSSDEPENGLGDGDTAPDWEITGNLTAKLRAERSGKGDGRQYTLAVECTDSSGNSSSGSVNVTVPHSQKK